MPVEPKTSPRTLLAMQCIFLVLLLIFGATLLHEGVRAIRHPPYTFRYTERTQWSVSGVAGGAEVEHGALEFRGRAATVFGAGLCAVGAMLLSWAAGIALSLLARVGLDAPLVVVKALGGLSLLALLTGCLALFPPWRLHMLPLYLVVAAFALAVALPVPTEWRKKVFPAAVILIFLVSFIRFPAFPVFAGIFVAFVLGTNLLVLWPALGRRLGRKPPRPH